MELATEVLESPSFSVQDTLLQMPEVTWTHSWLHDILRNIPVQVESLLDVGCSRGIVGALVRIYRNPKRMVGIDVFRKYLSFCRRMNFYDELYEYDLRQTPLPFSDKEFDVATCIEVVEHLPKNKGLTLLNELERIAETVIVTTPNAKFPVYRKHIFNQKDLDNNQFQHHLSGWAPEDFTKRAYKVRGVGDFLFFGRYIKYLSFYLSKLSYSVPTFSSTLLATRKG